MTKLEKVANQYGLKFIAKEKIAVGEISGVQFGLSSTENNAIFNMEININVQASGKSDMITQELKARAKTFKSVYNFALTPFSIKAQVSASSQKKIDELGEVFAYISQVISENGLRVCCSVCGEEKPTDVYSVNGEAKRICSSCSTEIINTQEHAEIENRSKKGSIPLGVVGAFVGALIGGALWVIIYQFDYVVALVGFVAIVCAYKGYIMLSGKKDVKAAIISVIVAAAVIFLAHCMCWSIMISQEFEMSFLDAVSITHLVAFDPEFIGAFMQDLLFGYVFMAVGAFTFIKNAIANPTGKTEFKKIDVSEVNI